MRLDGIEPTTPAWKAEVLPLNYSRENAAEHHRGPAAVKPGVRAGPGAFPYEGGFLPKFLRLRRGKGIAGTWQLRMPDCVMAFLSSASSGTAQPLRQSATSSGRPNVRAVQTLAKQKALEKKAQNYKLPLGELAIFTQQLASLLVAGLPLVQVLEALQDQTEDQCFRIVIRDVRLDISSGNSFSAAVKKFPRSFPTLFISMVEAGEASGALAEILGKVASYFESSVKLTKKVKSAMTYPVAVICLAIALVNVLLIFVIPVFAAMFADFGAKLPAPTQMLIT